MRRWAAAATVLGALAVILGVLAFNLARDEPGYAPGGGAIGAALLGTIAGWAITLAGLLAWRAGRSFGPLLAVAGPAWLVAACDLPAAPSAVVFTAALVFAYAAPALIADAALGPGHRALAAIPYVACIGVAGLAANTLYDPGAAGCEDCPANLVLVTSDAAAQATVTRWGLAIGAAGLALVVAVLVARLARSRPSQRLRDAPVLLASAVFLSLSAAQLAHGVSRGFVSNDKLDRLMWTSQALALLLLAAATAWEPLRRRRARAQLARLVVDLADAPAPGGLRDSLAHALGDPDLQLLYRTDENEWVWPDGTSAGVPGDDTTRLVAGDRVVGALIHRMGLLDDPALRDELSSAARLALEHERLNAATGKQLADLQASRARLVATGDAERRRLERDLHDGAQQRLVSVAISLGLAARAGDAELAWAHGELTAAVAELRELAHGIYPAVLGEEGLAAALETLAEGQPRLRLLDLTEQRAPEPVESAAYRIVIGVLYASDGPIEARIACADGFLTVETRGAIADLQEIKDRVGALNGTLDVAGDATLIAGLPLR
jgi:signal transduction histidine kinase